MREGGDSTHWESYAKKGTRDPRKYQLSPSGGTVTKAVFQTDEYGHPEPGHQLLPPSRAAAVY